MIELLEMHPWLSKFICSTCISADIFAYSPVLKWACLGAPETVWHWYSF